jgi:hypothetical protein
LGRRGIAVSVIVVCATCGVAVAPDGVVVIVGMPDLYPAAEENACSETAGGEVDKVGGDID